MRKVLIPALVLGAALAPVLADSNVTVYGQANVGVIAADNGTVKQSKVDNLWTSSRIGFKGEETLGDGLKAVWQIETHVFPDNAASVGLASREGWVGLAGEFGKVRLGRGTTPYAALADTANPFDGSDELNMRMTSDSAMGKLGGGISGRLNNSIRYDSPSMEGFNLSAVYSAGENKADGVWGKEGHGISVAAYYKLAGLTLGAGYQGEMANRYKWDDPATIAVESLNGVRDSSAWLLGASYKLDALNLALAYQHREKDAAKLGTQKKAERDTISSAVTYDMGSMMLMGGIMLGDKLKDGGATMANSKFTRYTVGSHFRVSKRTKLIAEYVGDDNQGATKDQSQLVVGVMHAF